MATRRHKKQKKINKKKIYTIKKNNLKKAISLQLAFGKQKSIAFSSH
jgi:hypothetical protein